MRSPLYAALFDYAGVFPPAALTVSAARREYDRATAGEHGWVVGPMLVLASSLDDPALAGLAGDRLGAVADTVPTRPVAQVEARVVAATAASVTADLRTVAPVVYLESEDPADLSFLEPIATARSVGVDVRAKIRTGGASAVAFPSPEQVAAFLTACVQRGLPWKATAGLHHPVRTTSEVPGATEHGFLNLLAATRCVLAGDAEAALAALRTTEAEDIDAPTGTFRGVGRGLEPEEVRATFRSIGSCSVSEPAEHLADLGVL